MSNRTVVNRIATHVMALAVVALLATATGCPPWDPPDDDPEPLSDVQLLFAVAGNGAATLMWLEQGEPSLDYVRVSWSPADGTPPLTVEPGIGTCAISGLDNGTEYTFVAQTVSVEGAVSDGVSVACTPAWQLMFGGSGSDVAHAVAPTADGGCVMAGSSTSTDLVDAYPPALTDNGQDNCYVIKLNASRSMEWHRLEGSVSDDVGYSVTQTPDGGYFVAGVWEVVVGEGNDVYMMKLGATGLRIWHNAFGGSDYDTAYDGAQTSDDDYLSAGITYSSDIPGQTNAGKGDFYVVKRAAGGGVLWERVFGGEGWDRAYALDLTADGGCVIAGVSDSMDIAGSTQDDFWDFFVAKLDADGNLAWQTMYGGTCVDYLFSVEETGDGGFIVAGSSQSTDIPGLAHPYPDPGPGSMYAVPAVYVAKFDSTGGLLWQKMYGYTDSSGYHSSSMARSIIQASDGGYAVAATVNTATHLAQVRILKLDSAGTVSWDRLYGGTGHDYPESIRQTPGGAYLIAGYSDSVDIAGAPNIGGEDCYLLVLD